MTTLSVQGDLISLILNFLYIVTLKQRLEKITAGLPADDNLVNMYSCKQPGSLASLLLPANNTLARSGRHSV